MIYGITPTLHSTTPIQAVQHATDILAAETTHKVIVIGVVFFTIALACCARKKATPILNASPEPSTPTNSDSDYSTSASSRSSSGDSLPSYANTPYSPGKRDTPDRVGMTPVGSTDPADDVVRELKWPANSTANTPAR